MITDVEGVRVGHWTDPVARTGCTVVVLPEGAVASGEVRGGAPATREFALLEPHRLVERVDAVVLCGGSAFGLAAADGVMRWLEQQERGFATGAGPVPIVVGLALYDLLEGDASVRPDADAGYAACAAARAGAFETGRVGAGAGATVGKWLGSQHRRPGGIGTATQRHGDLVVAALFAVNAFGDVDAREPDREPDTAFTEVFGLPLTNTVVGVVATNADLDKRACHLLAQSGHDGIARAVFPPHTRFDGDGIVAVAAGDVRASVDLVRALGIRAVESAIRHAAARPGPSAPSQQ